MCLCLCEILNLYTDILRLDVCYIEIMLRHFHRYVQVRGRTGPESINNSDRKTTDETLRPPPIFICLFSSLNGSPPSRDLLLSS